MCEPTNTGTLKSKEQLSEYIDKFEHQLSPYAKKLARQYNLRLEDHEDIYWTAWAKAWRYKLSPDAKNSFCAQEDTDVLKQMKTIFKNVAIDMSNRNGPVLRSLDGPRNDTDNSGLMLSDSILGKSFIEEFEVIMVIESVELTNGVEQLVYAYDLGKITAAELDERLDGYTPDYRRLARHRAKNKIIEALTSDK